MKNTIKLTLVLMISISVTSLVQAKNTEHNRKHQRPSFGTLDSNSDGEIDFKEFSSHKIPHGDHQTVFNIIDSNSDGVLSNDEFTDHKPPQRKKR